MSNPHRFSLARMGVRTFLFVVLAALVALPVTLLGLDFSERMAKLDRTLADRLARASADSLAAQVSLQMREFVHSAETMSSRASQCNGPVHSTPETTMNTARSTKCEAKARQPEASGLPRRLLLSPSPAK